MTDLSVERSSPTTGYSVSRPAPNCLQSDGTLVPSCLHIWAIDTAGLLSRMQLSCEKVSPTSKALAVFIVRQRRSIGSNKTRLGKSV
jgi:hypothetical protein